MQIKTSFFTLLLATTAIASCSHDNMANDNYDDSQNPAAQQNQLHRADSDMRRVLNAQQALGAKPIETLTPAEARRQPTPSDGVKHVLVEKGMDPNATLGVTTQDIFIPSPAGKIPARVYKPENADERLPVVVYYHGGGWVIGTIYTYDATPRSLAKSANAIVVSVEYRHAPENKFPAAHDDAFTAYKWIAQNAGRFAASRLWANPQAATWQSTPQSKRVIIISSLLFTRYSYTRSPEQI